MSHVRARRRHRKGRALAPLAAIPATVRQRWLELYDDTASERYATERTKLSDGDVRRLKREDPTFAEQYEEGKSGAGRYAELTASHPWISKRLKALKAFSESELYRRHIGAGEGGLTMQEVDEKVHEVIKVVGS